MDAHRFFVRCTVVSLLFACVIPAKAEPGDMVSMVQKSNYTAGDYFGKTMAVMGENVWVSSPYDDTVGDGAGAVFLYNSSGEVIQTIYNPTPYENARRYEYFGGGLAVIGNSVLVGDNKDSTYSNKAGTVFMFDAATGALQQEFRNPTGESDIYFGSAIASIGEDRILVGAYGKNKSEGAAYIFDTRNGQLLWTLTSPHQMYSRFGFSVASIGNIIAVSQPLYDQYDPYLLAYGKVHLFDATTYQHLRTLTDPTPGTSPSEQFGCSLAVLGDKLVVGGGKGVYVFDPKTGSLTLSIENPSLNQVKVAAAGDDILVGNFTYADNAGRAYLYDGMTGELLVEIPNPNSDRFDDFGNAIAGIDGYLVIGAPRDDLHGTSSGTVYLYENTAPEPATLSLFLLSGTILLKRRRRV